jgi:hypothetical protein
MGATQILPPRFDSSEMIKQILWLKSQNNFKDRTWYAHKATIR